MSFAFLVREVRSMSASVRCLVAFFISLCLATAGTLLSWPAFATSTSGINAQQVVQISQKKPKKPKKAVKVKKAVKKAKKGKKVAPRQTADQGSSWEPNIRPRQETVDPGAAPSNPTWADQLSDEDRQCLATRMAEVLSQTQLDKLNIFTALSYLPQFETAVNECGIELPSEAEMNQMQANIFFWYLTLNADQKSCLTSEWDAVVAEGVDPTADVLGMMISSLTTCGVAAPFGLG